MRTLLLALTVSLLPTPGAATALSDAWHADIDQLVEALKREHPMPAAKWDELDIEAQAAELKARVGTATDPEIMLGMATIVASLNDGHSRLTLPMKLAVGLSDAHTATQPPNDPELALDRYPVLIAPFGDRFHVVSARTEFEYLLGGRLIAVNDVPVAEIASRLEPLAHGENEHWKRRIIADRMTIPEVLAWAGIASGPEVHLSVEVDGRSESVRVAPAGTTRGDWLDITATMSDVPALWKTDDSPYGFEVLGDTLYFRFDEATYDRDLPPPELVRDMECVREQESLQRLVVDLRRNTGGNGTWNQTFLRWIIGHPIFDRWGHLYVLIGPDAFSAAMLFVNELEQHSRVLFVGETTGSSPDHYGDARKVRLDNSGLTVRISTIFWKNWLAGEFRDGIRPHIPVGAHMTDLLEGRDAALDVALSHRFTSVAETMEALFARGDINSAAVMAVKSAADPDRSEALLESMLDAGERHLRADNDDVARLFFLLAETGFSEDARPFFGLGRVAERSGDTAAARERFESALARDPAFGEARKALESLPADR
jgi:hypothetical protein